MIEELAAAIRGGVVLPGDPGYPAAALIWNARFDDARPLAVVRPADAADVCTVVNFARDHGVPLRARGGGHSFAGYSTGDGLMVDLSALLGVEIDEGGELATLGAGFANLTAYRALWPQRVAVCAGVCPTVGLTGLACGGGLGVLSRKHGLTSDNLLAAEIVTAGGRLLSVSESENQDLLWALRGGGGGNFGILTSLTFRTVPVDMPFTHARYRFPWSAAADVVAAWQEWMPASPAETWSLMELETQAPGSEPTVFVEVVHAGGPEGVEPSLAALVDAVGVGPEHRLLESGPFFAVEHDFFCRGLRRKECDLEDRTAAGAIARPALYARNDVVKERWPADAVGVVIDWMERRQRDPVLTPESFDEGHTVGKVLIEAADAAVNSVAPDATAFVHRDNLCMAQYQSRWRGGSGADVEEANLEWVRGLHAAMAPWRSGSVYQNYMDPELENWADAYYGANLPRLREVKGAYDPENLFNFEQSVPLP